MIIFLLEGLSSRSSCYRYQESFLSSYAVNVPVGPSGPSRTARTTSRESSSTDSIPAYPLRFVFVRRSLWVATARAGSPWISRLHAEKALRSHTEVKDSVCDVTGSLDGRVDRPSRVSSRQEVTTKTCIRRQTGLIRLPAGVIGVSVPTRQYVDLRGEVRFLATTAEPS